MPGRGFGSVLAASLTRLQLGEIRGGHRNCSRAGLPCDTRPSNKCGRTPPPQTSPPCPAATAPAFHPMPSCALPRLLLPTTFAHSTCPTCTRLLSCRGWRRFGGVLRDVAAGTRCLNIAATLSASRFARVRAAAPAHPVHVSLGIVLLRRRSVTVSIECAALALPSPLPSTVSLNCSIAPTCNIQVGGAPRAAEHRASTGVHGKICAGTCRADARS